MQGTQVQFLVEGLRSRLPRGQKIQNINNRGTTVTNRGFNSNQSILKEIRIFTGRMLKLKLQFFGHLMQRVSSLAKTMILGKIEGRRRRE